MLGIPAGIRRTVVLPRPGCCHTPCARLGKRLLWLGSQCNHKADEEFLLPVPFHYRRQCEFQTSRLAVNDNLLVYLRQLRQWRSAYLVVQCGVGIAHVDELRIAYFQLVSRVPVVLAQRYGIFELGQHGIDSDVLHRQVEEPLRLCATRQRHSHEDGCQYYPCIYK